MDDPAVSNLAPPASHLLEQVRPERTGPKEEIDMRLVDNLRKAEEKGVMSIRRSMERARDEWSDSRAVIRARRTAQADCFNPWTGPLSKYSSYTVLRPSNTKAGTF
jgi:hypothetical protein